MFKKILIANRGEIALRSHRACREMGIRTVGVHSTGDNDAMHTRLVDESICIGGPTSRESYLNMPALISAATITGADAIHPGVGFLSENSEFAQMVIDHGFTFIGPSPELIRVMGDKILAKQAVETLGIPVVPGTQSPVTVDDDVETLAKEIGYPILVKAAGGGGGKGMQVVLSFDRLHEALKIAGAEAKANFGNESVFMERYLGRPRHIEIQVLADHYGNVVHLGERDCSLQRRHQKIWEEAPSPAIALAQRMELGAKVAKATKDMGYQGVGTFEFLYENGEFFFIEMNTRIQVEHPISEMITGIDLIREQIRVAAGLPLGFTQDDVHFNGHAIECRINAEHAQTFMPSPGKITFYHPPGGPNVRVDSALYTGYSIPPYYDSLISKLIVWGRDRPECLMRLRRALEEYVIGGVETLLPLHTKLSQNTDIQAGQYDIRWLEEFLAGELEKAA